MKGYYGCFVLQQFAIGHINAPLLSKSSTEKASSTYTISYTTRCDTSECLFLRGLNAGPAGRGGESRFIGDVFGRGRRVDLAELATTSAA